MDRNTEKIFRRLPVSIKERVDELPEIIRDDLKRYASESSATRSS